MLIDYLPKDILEELPNDPNDAWLDIVKTVFAVVREEINGRSDQVFDRILTREAVEFSASVASTLGLHEGIVTNLKLLDVDNGLPEVEKIYGQLSKDRFNERLPDKFVTREVTNQQSEDTLLISNRSIVEVHNHLRHLRIFVDGSSLDDQRKKQLSKLLDEFERLLNSKKSSKNNLLTTFALLAAGIGGTTAFLADAPDALRTVGEIAAVLGEEVSSSEAVRQIEIKQPDPLLEAPNSDNIGP